MCPSCGSNLQCDCNIPIKPFCSTCLKDDTCDVKINAKCVFYHLDTKVASNLTCLGIGNKINLEAILEEIDEKLCSYQALQTPLTVVDTTSINFTSSGTAGHTLTGNVIIDTVSTNNILTVNSNGLYVPPTTIPVIPPIPADLTFDNGLTRTINNVRLGGTLSTNTTIGLSDKTFTVSGNNALSKIVLSTNLSNYEVSQSQHYTSAFSGVAAPNDIATTNVLNEGYTETIIATETARNTIGFIVDSDLLLQSDTSNGKKDARIGVSVPISYMPLDVPVPNQTQYTCFSLWSNNPTETITQGRMITYSPHVAFVGITGVNGNNTKVGINSSEPSNPLDIISNILTTPSLRIRTPFTPTSATASGLKGEITWDNTYIYICVETNQWKRTAISTW